MNFVTTGFVTDNQDPDNMGRVKIRLYLSQIPTETDWLPVIQSFAGDDKGIFSLPDIDDYVLACFANDSCRKGYILGSMWPQQIPLPASEENSAADFNGDGNNALRMIKSKTGQRIILDDTDGAEKIQILNPDGTTRFELNGEEEVLNLESETDITLSSSTIVSIEAEEMEVNIEGDMTVQCDNLGSETAGDGTINAGGSIAIEGQGVGIN
ncbi:MAG: phage baseplate assembly protein V [Spirochaetales bacterium]|nr:phage baseplate assembly protein V [Spirochaetales bacterium]